MRALILGVVLVAATAAHAEDGNCVRERAVKQRLCDTKNYVMKPNEYGWYGIGPECRPERGKGFGWKQQKAVACDCPSPCDLNGE